MKRVIVTVAIITRNRDKSLQRCLFSLVNQRQNSFELLIIDNASTDTTKEVVSKFQSLRPLRYIFEPKVSIPLARNRALEEAKGSIVAFIDDDCVASYSWVNQIIKAHHQFSKAAAIQGKTTAEPKNNVLAQVTESLYEVWIQGNLNKSKQLGVGDTKNISFKKNILNRLKLRFDTSLSRGSDVDFAYQLLSNKQEIIYYPRIVSKHWGRSTLFSSLKQRFMQGKARSKINYKWYSYLRTIKPKAIDLNNQATYSSGILFKTILMLFKVAFRTGLFLETKRRDWDITRLDKSPKSKGIKLYESLSVLVFLEDNLHEINSLLISLENQIVRPNKILIFHLQKNLSEKKLSLKKNYELKEYNSLYQAINWALKNLPEDIITVLPSDSKVNTDWSRNVLQAHSEHPDAIAIQGRALYSSNTLTALVKQIQFDLWVLKNLSQDNLFTSLDLDSLSLNRTLLKTHHILFPEDADYSLNRGGAAFLANEINLQKIPIIFYPAVSIYRSYKKSLKAFLKESFIEGKAEKLIEFDWLRLKPKKTLISRLDTLVLMVKSLHLQKKLFNFPSILFALIYSSYMRRIGSNNVKDFLELHPRMPAKLKYIPQKIEANYIEIAIITRNRAKLLRQCLTSLLYQTIRPARIIIIDNGSSDNSKEIVNFFQKYLPLDYFYEPKIGTSYARNRALDESKTELLAFLDDDSFVPPFWLSRILEGHQTYPNAIAIQGRSSSHPAESIYSVISQYNRHNWMLRNMNISIEKYYKSISGLLKRDYKINTIDTRNVSIRIQELKHSGIHFDEGLFKGEDTDLAQQLEKKKQKIFFYPKALAYHQEREDLQSFFKQSFEKGRAWTCLTEKWPDKFSFSYLKALNNIFGFWTFYRINRYRTNFLILFAIYILERCIFFPSGFFYQKLLLSMNRLFRFNLSTYSKSINDRF